MKKEYLKVVFQKEVIRLAGFNLSIKNSQITISRNDNFNKTYKELPELSELVNDYADWKAKIAKAELTALF